MTRVCGQMMPINDKRREIAERLREIAGEYVTTDDFQRVIGFSISTEIDIDRDAEELQYLADLIDSTCEVESHIAGEGSIMMLTITSDE